MIAQNDTLIFDEDIFCRLIETAHALQVCELSQLPTFCCGLTVRVGEQALPVSVTVGGDLNMVGLVGQGHRVFVDYVVIGASFVVLDPKGRCQVITRSVQAAHS
ncbi:hypothetical protein [Aeromonas jandaei]|uniref:hypothetical protein n=1 Tax=Aeromonas jandaei TaxID=650 RepID=UPI0013FDCA28|nr:hypothetical protein [Aeromonas jandaei]